MLTGKYTYMLSRPFVCLFCSDLGVRLADHVHLQGAEVVVCIVSWNTLTRSFIPTTFFYTNHILCTSCLPMLFCLHLS